MEIGHKHEHIPIYPLYQQALSQQNRIGWDHFIRGRLLITWGQIVNDHMVHNGITSTTAEKWGSALTKLNWEYVLRILTKQNEELHGLTKEYQDRLQKQDMTAELKQLQQEHLDMPHIQRRLISASEERMKEMTKFRLASYLAGARILAKANKSLCTANGRFYRRMNFFKVRSQI
jgi:hypothetical protein